MTPLTNTVVSEIATHALADNVLEEIVLAGARGLATPPVPGCAEPRATYRARPELRRERLSSLLRCANELLRRAVIADSIGRTIVDRPVVLMELLVMHFRLYQAEAFAVLFLDSHLALLGIEEMFRGSLTSTSVYPREVVKRALAYNASGVILAHNHPSGLPEPSRADEALTVLLKNALCLVDVRVLDHVIVAGTSTVSFAARGLI